MFDVEFVVQALQFFLRVFIIKWNRSFWFDDKIFTKLTFAYFGLQCWLECQINIWKFQVFWKFFEILFKKPLEILIFNKIKWAFFMRIGWIYMFINHCLTLFKFIKHHKQIAKECTKSLWVGLLNYSQFIPPKVSTNYFYKNILEPNHPIPLLTQPWVFYLLSSAPNLDTIYWIWNYL